MIKANGEDESLKYNVQTLPHIIQQEQLLPFSPLFLTKLLNYKM